MPVGDLLSLAHAQSRSEAAASRIRVKQARASARSLICVALPVFARAATMSFDLPETDMVYVSGLPSGTTEDDLAQYFGSIGVIKLDKKTK